jgi:glycosyltransferase involved in cell wall biosynthesis
MLSSFPPSHCGIGRFASSLSGALNEGHLEVDIVRALTPGGVPAFTRDVVMEFDPWGEPCLEAIASRLERYDVVIVQHEFGLYGPADGRLLVELLAMLRNVRIMTVLHTVLERPTAHQREVLLELGDRSSVLVVPSHAARVKLHDVYGIRADDVRVVPHGTHWSAVAPNPPPRRSIVTWGLLGPGKGIERIIEAMPYLRHLTPRVEFEVVGETHPNVLRSEGSRYRDRLVDLARELEVSDAVSFVTGYQSEASLYRLAGSADVVAVTYDNDEQICSGVLTEALSVGRPVIATAFPHAVELLGSGAGVIVRRDDPKGTAHAIERLLVDERTYRLAGFEALRKASTMSWPSVAASYASIVESVRNQVVRAV